MAVLGFDPVRKRWIASARADLQNRGIPDLDGVLLTDPSSLATDAVDVGNIVHEAPVAVLRPGSVADIQKMVRFARCHDIKVAARGQGHTTFGQSQVDHGLVIEMSALNRIHSIDPNGADVDAGVKWRDLVDATVAVSLTPPVLTGFIGLSVGGTLSVGGVSSTNAQGAQVDRVQELEVVTGEGEVVRCSKRKNAELFEGVLAGLGQLGIITRAVIDLVPAKPQARTFLLTYVDNAVFFRDFRALLRRGEFSDIFNIWLPDGNGGFVYQLNATVFFDPGSSPDNAHLLRGLSVDSANLQVGDQSYRDYVLRVDVVIDLFRQIGLFDGVTHPWFDVFLSDQTVENYVGDVIPTLQPDDVGATGFLLLFAQKRAKLTRPFLRVPEETEWVYLFDILTAGAAPGPDPDFVDRMLKRNRTLFEKARRVGGTRYPIGSISFNHGDWVRQYGEEWPELVRLKHRFDPDFVLTPGPGIFGR